MVHALEEEKASLRNRYAVYTSTNEGREVAVESQSILHAVHHDSSLH